MGDSNNIHAAVIMAGGSGERFWPLSRRSHPKQLLKLGSGGRSLLDQTIHNIQPLIGNDSVFLATGGYIADKVRESGSDIPQDNILVEPQKRNTAGCLVYAAACLLARYGGDGSNITMAVLPADHSIGRPERFRSLVDAALTTAEKEDALVTFGITPTRPETGYGYLELSDTALSATGQNDEAPVFDVLKFREKPNLATAERYLAGGRHFWNSGMFFWRISTFVRELTEAAPEMATRFHEIVAALRNGDDATACASFVKLESISIDFALMEKAERVLAIKADIDWDDVGAWDSLDRTFPCDDHGNVTIGNPILIDAKDCIVYNEPGENSIAVSVVGVEGLAVVVTKDGVLVIPKDRAQDVRQVVDELKKKENGHL